MSLKYLLTAEYSYIGYEACAEGRRYAKDAVSKSEDLPIEYKRLFKQSISFFDSYIRIRDFVFDLILGHAYEGRFDYFVETLTDNGEPVTNDWQELFSRFVYLEMFWLFPNETLEQFESEFKLKSEENNTSFTHVLAEKCTYKECKLCSGNFDYVKLIRKNKDLSIGYEGLLSQSMSFYSGYVRIQEFLYNLAYGDKTFLKDNFNDFVKTLRPTYGIPYPNDQQVLFREFINEKISGLFPLGVLNQFGRELNLMYRAEEKS